MKPNIVLIMADQLRADLRASCGYPLDTMPFLDAWARGGLDFERAYTANPTCMPARVSLLTGRYPSSHRVRTNHNAMDAYYAQDLLDILKKYGYRTALCGKNHTHRSPEDFDFAETNGHTGLTNMADCSPQEQTFAQFLSELSSRESMSCSPGTVREQFPYRNVSAALRFIDGLSKDTPFFAWVSFAEPHPPYQVPKPYFNLFPPDALPPILSGPEDLPDKGPRYVWIKRQWERVFGEKEQEHVLRARSNYMGMLRLIDDQLRRLINGLEQRRLLENTLVIFLADHGDFVGEYGLTRKGPDLSQVLTRIPMIFRGPGVASSGVNRDACVNIVDVLPTICELIGEPLPVGCQGRSLIPLLRGEHVTHEFEVGYVESGYGGLYWNESDALEPVQEGATKDYTTFDTLNSWTQSGQVRMIRKGDYSLQIDMLGDAYLYCLKDDPFERFNLLGRPECAEIASDMFREIASAMLRACDPLPLPRHRYRLKMHPQGYWRQPFSAVDPGVQDALPPRNDLSPGNMSKNGQH